MGDSVDNVPGVPGVGPKTAVAADPAIWRRRGRARRMPTRSRSPSCKQNLIEHAEMARLSRELVRLVCDAPLPEPLEDLAMKGIPDEPLREFLEHHGFQLAARPARRHVAGARRRSTVSEAPTQARGPARAEDRPLALRDRDRRGGARPLDRRGAARNGLGRDRHRDRRARLRHRQAGRDQPRHRMQQGLLHPARTWRRRPVRRAARAAAGRAGARRS